MASEERPETGQVIPFAFVNHRFRRGLRFGIAPTDLMRHAWVLGQTGTGKSTLLETLFLGLADAGMGAGLIDPHGDLAARLPARIPRVRRSDLVLFDPAAPGPKPSLNLVGFAPPAERPRLASATLSVLRKTFAEGWGPRTEHILRNSILTLLDVPRSTLAGVVRLLTEERFREMALRHINDPIVRHFWEEEFRQIPPAFRAEVVAPALNKLGALLASPIIRAHVDQPRRMLDLRAVIDHGRLFVANLSKGRIGEDASAFLGTVLVSCFQLATYARADTPAAERRPFTLLVDEFPTFATPSFAELLAEARKYGVGLIVANQHLAQIDERLRSALLGNAGTLVVFRVSADDARLLEPEFAPELDAGDLARLGRHEIALKLSIDGETSKPFTAGTIALAGSQHIHSPPRLPRPTPTSRGPSFPVR